MNFMLNVMTGDDIPMIAQPSDTVERIKETVEHKYGFHLQNKFSCWVGENSKINKLLLRQEFQRERRWQFCSKEKNLSSHSRVWSLGKLMGLFLKLPKNQ